MSRPAWRVWVTVLDPDPPESLQTKRVFTAKSRDNLEGVVRKHYNPIRVRIQKAKAIKSQPAEQ